MIIKRSRSALQSRRPSLTGLLYGVLFSPVLIYAFYWGNRDFNVGSDTVTYVALFRAYLLRSPGLLSTGDPGFLALMGAVETFTHNPSALLLAFCVLIALFFYVAGVLVIKKAQYILLYVVLLLISPYYLSININILRHGLTTAIAIFLMALVLSYRNILLKLATFYVPTLFHSVGGLIVLPMIWGTKKMFPLVFWVPAALISAFSELYAPLFSQFIPSDYGTYVTVNAGYRTGFRPDFILFSAIPLLFTLIVPYGKMSVETRWVLNAYLLMNGFGHLMNFVSYSDRFLTSSWTLLPLLVALMVKDINDRAFKKSQNKKFFSIIIIAGTLVVNSFFYLRGV
ncbi:EpsG family protein [Deinococcus malanensis]|uniref:EpsG family protein n=1 Tax=Deinococcus malanensis TaxID=1706855 RepID=UPI001662B3E7|nr:EpsG family protein [Deinococcus malanensis]